MRKHRSLRNTVGRRWLMLLTVLAVALFAQARHLKDILDEALQAVVHDTSGPVQWMPSRMLIEERTDEDEA